MIARSKLPVNYEPPRMILPGLGVYVNLEDFVGLTFQARHEHVGSLAYPKPGTPSSKTAYRLAFIHYTPERVASGDTRQRIAALPTTQAFLAPEMRSSKAEKDLIKAMQTDSFANFIRDGSCIMEDEGFVPYVGRVSYMVVRYLLMQAHGRFEFEIDPRMFADSITYRSAAGERVAVPAWEMAPTVQAKEDNEREIMRQASKSRFDDHIFKHGSMIPSSFYHSESIKEEATKRIEIEDGDSDEDQRDGTAEEGCDHNDCGEGYWSSLVQIKSKPAATASAQFRHRAKKGSSKADEPFKFLRELTVEAIDHEVLELRAELRAEEIMQEDDGEDVDLDALKESIDGANDAVETGGVSEPAIVGIYRIIKDARQLSDHILLEASKLRSFRRSLIKAQTSVRTWIEGPVAEGAYIAAMNDRSAGAGARQTWLSRLTNHVVDMLVSKTRKRTFRSKEYGVSWNREATVVNTHWRRNMLRRQEETIKEAVAMVVDIVETWADAESVCDRKQAWFASTVEDVMGSEALSMNLFWKLYQDVKPAHIIPGDKGYRNLTKKDVSQFRESLENHSVTDQDHREGQLFDLYKSLLNGDVKPGDIVEALPSVSPTWHSIVEMITTAAMFDNDNDMQPTERSPYLKKLQVDPQTYHPMPERTIPRIKCERELTGGPVPMTKEAMFSLLVWRSYPQAFPWHPNQSMLYSSPEDFFKSYKATTKSPPSDLVQRSVNRMWHSLKEAKTQTVTRSYPTFDACYQHFRPPGSLETRLFPGLSRTATFDVVCDLVYAGLCRPPTTADVAKYIIHMNQGSMTGLKALGLMDGKKLDLDTKRQQVHQALIDLGCVLMKVPEFALYQKEVAAGLEIEIYGDGEVDPIGIEHVLRCFAHAHKYLQQ
ncbi:hypothetical protein MD484_g7826, partial [Candolleomyces efflorescens]